ncbi:hypothetical protein [Streptomyces sp. DH7]|uniref:hypothetical protein n=1 Tax=Streptomyces sp. DH7 TaxID=2857006 RepID=UPI001E51C0E7|nr:hypothetical protein [Streptomyces sp. DH7]
MSTRTHPPDRAGQVAGEDVAASGAGHEGVPLAAGPEPDRPARASAVRGVATAPGGPLARRWPKVQEIY